MYRKHVIILLLSVVALVGIYDLSTALSNEEQIDFNTQIRPILNKKCISCHGGVKQSGGFSLLFPEEALEVNESGKPAIIPGNSKESELIRRISHHDPEVRMPLEGQALSEDEIDLIAKWIDQGAKWGKHWAFVKPEPIAVPTVSSDWIKTDIDKFILSSLEDNDLKPSAQADKATLLRRVSLDLTGLPPTLSEVQRFVNDNNPDAYEKAVDRLLSSPNYGERWASMWMDLARYADSKGYEKDGFRNIWQYRDWLIHAFNEDKPYDKFIIEQLAGDLLPNPDDKQYIATGFHRNTHSNDEAGTSNEEFRISSVIDRVNTTWNGVLATTMECVQCHSHPYDPIRHEDYYKSFAFFNNTADADVESESPKLKTFKSDADKEGLEKVKNWIEKNTPASNKKDELIAGYVNMVRLTEPKIHSHSFDKLSNGVLLSNNQDLALESGGYGRMAKVPLNDANQMLIRYKDAQYPGQIEIRLGSPQGKLLGALQVSKDAKPGFQIAGVPIIPVAGKHDLYLVYKPLPKTVAPTKKRRKKKASPNAMPAKANAMPTKSTPLKSKAMPVKANAMPTNKVKKGFACTIQWVLFNKDLPGRGKPGFTEAKNTFFSLLNSTEALESPVMVELTGGYGRETHLFERGNWMVHGNKVMPGVPEALNPMPAGAPNNRLGLAQWVVNKDNPLTARVMVNRVWSQLFGTGIVETLEDFGSMGATPSHPFLLDWLSLQFMNENNCSVKKLLKIMVMSATYQQSSKVSPELLAKDPKNRLLSRGSRIRLNAEQVRDQAIAVSGLLSPKMFGPSVMPVQPEGLWLIAYSNLKWETSKGEDKHRRAIYTFWRRSRPYPSLIAFDSPTRDVCSTRRINTNTPLQALVTLNDPVYIEAGEALAKRMLADTKLVRDQIKKGYRLALMKEIDSEKLQELEKLYSLTIEHYKKDPEAAEKLIGEKDINTAALTVVANVIMNLDEFITKG